MEIVSSTTEVRRIRSSTAPVWALLLLAPVIAEVLSGATRLSFLFALVPEIMVWGCGALIIREIVVRWRGGWTSMLLLGLALSMAEEFVIQQTSIAPLPWLGTGASYGRAWGVNWVYLLYMLGYESVWVVLVPVQLVELVYPGRRAESWLRARGLTIASAVFLAGSFIAWFTWTQQARTKVFHAANYSPPATLLAIGVAAIALLTLAAWTARGVTGKGEARRGNAPAPWVAGCGTFLLALPWWALISLVFLPNPRVAASVALASGVLWAGLAFFAIRHLSSRSGWNDGQRLALVAGAVVACMAGGFLGSNAWPGMDLTGKIVLNVLAVVLLWMLSRKVGRA